MNNYIAIAVLIGLGTLLSDFHLHKPGPDQPTTYATNYAANNNAAAK